MAIDTPAPKTPEASGKEFATRINDAVQRNDAKLYSDTMTGINDWTLHHSSSLHGKFEESLIGSVDLKTAALYETRENFAKIDKDKDGKAKPDELRAYAASGDSNALQKAMINKEVLPNNDTIANYSSDRFTRFFGQKDEHIRMADLDKGLQAASASRPRENLSEAQLAKRVDSPDFDRNALNYARENFSAIDADRNEKLTVTELQQYGADKSRSNLEKAYIEKGLVPKIDSIANNSLDNKLSFLGKKDTDIRMKDLDEGIKKLDQASTGAETQKAKPIEPNSKLMELATVRKGEGPFHSAERILAAAGGKHGIDEVRALTKALKQVYNEEGHGELKDLRVKHNFVTRENFEKLVNKVDNEAVREALRKMAAA